MSVQYKLFRHSSMIPFLFFFRLTAAGTGEPPRYVCGSELAERVSHLSWNVPGRALFLGGLNEPSFLLEKVGNILHRKALNEASKRLYKIKPVTTTVARNLSCRRCISLQFSLGIFFLPLSVWFIIIIIMIMWSRHNILHLTRSFPPFLSRSLFACAPSLWPLSTF